MEFRLGLYKALPSVCRQGGASAADVIGGG
jgi:hypothetical protein